MPRISKRATILQLLDNADAGCLPLEREQLLSRAVSEAESGRDVATRSLVYTARARMYFDTGRYHECLNDIRHAGDLVKGRDDYSISFLYGCALLYTGAYSEAITQLNRAVDIARTEGKPDREGAAMESLGNTYVTLGSYEQGFRYLKRAEEIFRDGNLTVQLAGVLHNLSMAYSESGDREQQLVHLNESVALMEQHGSKPGALVVSLNSVAAYHLSNNDPGRAIEYAMRSIALARETKNDNRRAEAQLNYALALCRVGNASKAVAVAKEALTTFSAAGHRRFECRALMTLAFAQYLRGKRRSTREALLRAAKLAGTIGAKSDMIEAYDGLYQICTEENDFPGALEYQRLYYQARLEVAENDAMQKMEYERTVRQAEEAMREIERSRENERRLRDELQQKQHELEQNALTLAEQSKLLSTVKQSLWNILGHPPRQAQRVVKESIEAVNRFELKNDPWEQFLRQFNTIHTGFLQRIASRCPALSSAELKMCALLRMNMNTKDIANLLTLSTRTVENHRLSLRKKLQLHPDTSLNTWLAML